MEVNHGKNDIELTRARLREEVRNIPFKKPASPQTVPLQKKLLSRKFLTALLILCIIVVSLIIFLRQESPLQENRPIRTPAAPSKIYSAPAQAQSDQSISSVMQVPEKTSQNADTEQPKPAGRYPSGWPDELRYPAQFVMEDANTVRTPDQSQPAYAVKLHYDGDMQAAAKSLSSYLESQGWQVSERSELDSGAISIKLTRNNGRDTSEILIDPYPEEPGKVRILAIVFL